MAKYRQLHTEYWNDGFVLDLTPEEKYFYIYLMTNSNTTQCGIYELPKRIIETQTGYNRETVDKLLKRFEEYNKIKYSENTKEIMMLNWIKYNQPNNCNAIKCVNKELKNVKNREFISILYNQCVNQELDVEAMFIGIELQHLTKGYEGACKGPISKEVISNKKEIISKKEEEGVIKDPSAAASMGEVIEYFKKNIYTPKDLEYKKLYAFADKISPDLIIMAIEEAVNYKAKSIKYIENILSSWIEKGLTSVEEVIKYKEFWKIQKGKGEKNKPSGWDFEQREYDFDKLERQLLGWVEGG